MGKQHADKESVAARVEQRIARLHDERQWVITQARKHRITDADMDVQLKALQDQEIAFQRELEDYRITPVFAGTIPVQSAGAEAGDMDRSRSRSADLNSGDWSPESGYATFTLKLTLALKEMGITM